MAEDLTAPWLNLTAEEKRLFGHLFRQADSESIGVVTGEAAVKFFEKTKLEPRVLGEIWQIADKENRGLLTPAGFGLVLRLIGHYQAGRDPTPQLALQPGPLPRFENVNNSGSNNTLQSPLSPPPGVLEPQVTGSGSVRVPPLTPDKVAQYAALFEKSGAQGGVLPGEQAKQIFERASLPNEVLGKIWNLADTEQKGALEVTEFVIAMHLIASFKTGQLRAIPNSLPFSLYEAASRRATSRSASGTVVLPPIPKQPTGASGTRAIYAHTPQLLSQATGSVNSWIITPADQSKFDSIFNTLDKTNRGFITGDEAVPFFCESRLPEDILAQIWDLADINSAGCLSREEFAVAMYLIRQQRGNRDRREQLPATLPPNLIPPSMRNKNRPIAVATAPNFEAPAPVLPRSAAEDLFGLDDLSSPNSSSEKTASNNEGPALFNATREINSVSNSTFSPAPPLTQTPQVKPFTPSSSFGQSLNHHNTGTTNSSAPSLPKNLRSISSEDLLGDNDPEISKKLTNETTELANLSNQVGSLSNQIKDIQGQKVISQSELTQSSNQKRELELRLTQLRDLYEQEVKEVRSLQERLTSLRNEVKTLQIEGETLENSLQNLRNEHTQVIKALQVDQLENYNLKENIRIVNTEIVQLKTVLEKATLDARQQKGLVAINRKQLSTSEAERDRIKSEAEEISEKNKEGPDNHVVSLKKENSASNASSVPSTSSSKNPFFRRKELPSENTFPQPDNTSIGSQQPGNFLKNVFGPFGSPTAIESPNSKTEIENRPSSSESIINAPVFPQLTASGSEIKALPLLSKPSLPQEHPKSIEDSLSPPEHGQVNSSFSFSMSQNSVSSTTDQVVSHDLSPKLSTSASGFGIPAEISSSEPHSNIFDATTEKITGGENFASDPFMFQSLARSGTAKDDFDSAFVGFGSSERVQEFTLTGGSNRSNSAGGNNIVGFVKEFPPITELENDDSDSTCDGVGFDDDFASVSNNLVCNTKTNFDIPIKPRTIEVSTDTLSQNNHSDAIQVSENYQARSESLTSLKNHSSQDVSTSLSYNSSGIVSSSSIVTQTNSKGQSKQSQSAPSLESQSDEEFDEFHDLVDAKEGDADDEFARVSGNDKFSTNDFNTIFDKQKEADNSGVNAFKNFSQPNHSVMQSSSNINDRYDWGVIFTGLEASDSLPTKPAVTLTNNTRSNERPQSNRTPTETDLPDDPILNKLTVMGYQKIEALNALEKYDYDIERAANFLASQS